MMYDIVFGDYSFEDKDEDSTILHELLTGNSGVALDGFSKRKTSLLNNDTRSKIENKKAANLRRNEDDIFEEEGDVYEHRTDKDRGYRNMAERNWKVDHVSKNENEVYKTKDSQIHHNIPELNEGIDVSESLNKIYKTKEKKTTYHDIPEPVEEVEDVSESVNKIYKTKEKETTYHDIPEPAEEVEDVSESVNKIYKTEERNFYHTIPEQDEEEDVGVDVEHSADAGTEHKKLQERLLAMLNSYKFDAGGTSELQNNKASDLIINTYMRSGSTFLGKLFSIRSDTFYVFEPLWYVHKFAYFNGIHDICHYFKNRCANPGRPAVAARIGSSIKWGQALDFLRGLLDCNFKHHNRFLPDRKHFPKEFKHDHSWNFAKGQAWNTYFDCSKRRGSTYDQCFKEMRPVCQSKKHKVFKVLRSTVDNFEPFLNERKQLRVIHLFRDPRGIINSHLHTAFFKNKLPKMRDVKLDVQTMCDRMRVDIRSALHLQRVFKDRFRIVQYEDFNDLLFNAKTLYKFMEMDVSPKLEAGLESLKYSQNESHGFHPYSYTKSLSWEVVTMVQTECQDVLKALGYPEFKSKHQMQKFQDEPYKPKLPFSLSNRT